MHDFGLAPETETAMIGLNGDRSSMFKKGKEQVEIVLVNISDFFRDNDIERIELMKINIEGGEYDLLDYLIDTGEINRLLNIQIQFHESIPDSYSRLNNIEQRLKMTHFLTYRYPHVWENWKLRE